MTDCALVNRSVSFDVDKRRIDVRAQSAKQRTYVVEHKDDIAYSYPRIRAGQPRPKQPIASYVVRRTHVKRVDKLVEGRVASWGNVSAWGVDAAAAVAALTKKLLREGR